MKISVGICTYNGEKYIREQLESIINQSIKPDEIIISDDASEDNTIQIIESILSESDISYIINKNDVRQGLHSNFTKCFELCTGDVIFSCDQDDVWYEKKIETFLPYFYEENIFVYSNAIIVDHERKCINNNFWGVYNISFDSLEVNEFSKILLNNMCIAGCNMAFRRELFEKIVPIPFHFIHDSWIAICAPLFGQVAFINKPTMEYRQHGNNTSSFKSDEHKESISSSKVIFDDMKKIEPNKWFNLPAHYYMSNLEFYDSMNQYMNEEYKEMVLKCKNFNYNLMQCLPNCKWKGIF